MASADQLSCRTLVGGQVVGPYGKPKPAGAQRSARASVGEGWAGIGARTIPKRGPPPRPPRQRLAKRKARKEQLVKFSLCPIPSECSTAYYARKSQQSPARVPAEAASTEQDRLEPRPAARQGASRARNCAAKSVFSFDGSTAVFFLGLTKKKMGVESCRASPAPPVSQPDQAPFPGKHRKNCKNLLDFCILSGIIIWLAVCEQILALIFE